MTAWATGAWAAGAWAGTAWQTAATVEVPDVSGLTQGQAVAALELAGFVVSVATATSSAVAAGSVISQQPAGGAQALPGSTVTITVSTGDSVATDPKLIAGPRRYKNLGFKPPKRKREEPPAPAQPPKAKASGLLKGLLSRIAPPELAAGLEIPPPVVVAEAVAEAVAEVAPQPSIAVEKQEVGELEQLRQRVEALTRMVTEISAEVQQLRQSHGPQPMPALRDPLDDALVALLPAVREPIELDEPEEPAGLPELDEDEQRELSGEAPPAAPPAAPAIDLGTENRRRAEILARSLL